MTTFNDLMPAQKVIITFFGRLLVILIPPQNTLEFHFDTFFFSHTITRRKGTRAVEVLLKSVVSMASLEATGKEKSALFRKTMKSVVHTMQNNIMNIVSSKECS
jgi:hypothetical protein